MIESFFYDTRNRIRRLVCSAFALLVVGIPLGLFMTGCRTSPDSEKVQLIFWHAWGGFEGKFLESLVEEFNQSHAHIQVKPAHFLIGDKLMAAIAGGIPPDVATVWDWMLPTMGEAECFIPLNDYLRKSDIQPEDYLPNIWEYGMFSDRKYGVPTALNVWMIFYNKKLYREAGLDPNAPPTTLEELERCAERLAIYDASGRLDRIGFIPEFQYTYIWMWNFGGRLYDPETRRFLLDSPENIRALTWVKRFYDRYGIKTYRRFVATFGEYDSPNNPFYKEKIAMREDGQWQIGFIQKNAPKLDYDLIPFVNAVPGQPSLSAVTGSFWVIPEGCRHPNEAWEFLSWLIAPHQSARFASTLYNIPPLRAALEDPQFQELQKTKMKTFVDFLLEGRGRSLPAVPIGQFYYNEFNNSVESVCAGSTTPEAGLRQLQRRLQDELDRTLHHLGLDVE